MTRLTMAEQVSRMRSRFPNLRYTERCSWWGRWAGPVRPLHCIHTIQIQYLRRYWLGELEIINGYLPEVVLVDPPLTLEHPRTGEPVPHVYWRNEKPELSTLCLYDPAASQWCPDDAIADTIVPWACEWLACYEGWLATAEWAGSGRHPGRRRNNTCQVNPDLTPDPQGRGQPAAFHSVGNDQPPLSDPDEMSVHEDIGGWG